MWFGVGIDLGTSFASAAVGGPGGTRMVSLSPEVVVPSVACPAPDGSVLTGVQALNAGADPGSIARGFKRRLGDPSRIVLGGTSFSPSALMAAQLRDTLATVTRIQGGPPSSVVLTCPAIWGPYRREHFAEVPRLAGVSNYRLVTEPEAAATHYSNERRLGEGEVVAVYDLGGGTFDTTILRVRANGMEILGTPEGIEHMGGIDFDETLLANIDDRLDGAVTALDAEDPEQAKALAAIRAMAVKAKEDLSIEPDVTLQVPLPSGPREVVISRLEFNDMIRPSVQLTTETLRRTVTSAGLRLDNLSAVLLAGGSSRIPLVSQMVSREFGKPVRATLHPKFTVALGAAAIAARPDVKPATGPGPTTAPAAAMTAPSPADTKITAISLVPAPANGKPAAGAGRSKKRAALIAAGVAAVVGIGTTVLIATTQSSDRQSGTTGTTPLSIGESNVNSAAPSGSAAPTGGAANEPAGDAPKPLTVFDGGDVDPWNGLIGSQATNWSGTDVSSNKRAKDGALTAQLDGKGGVQATWSGGPAHLYFQSSADSSEAQDLSEYFSSDGAIVFDVKVTKAPTAATSLEVHCTHPCHSKVSVERVLKRLPVGKKSRVVIPLSCFTKNHANAWNPEKINTPWLVYTEGSFSATFSNVRWAPELGSSAQAISCQELL